MSKVLTFLIFIITSSLYSKWELFKHDKFINFYTNFVFLQDELLINSRIGLMVYDNQNWKEIKLPNSSDTVRYIFYTKENNNKVWLANKKEIYLYSNKELSKIKIKLPFDSIRNRQPSFDLESDEIEGIHVDSKNTLWVITRVGLYSYKDGVWKDNYLDMKYYKEVDYILKFIKLYHINGYEDTLVLSTNYKYTKMWESGDTIKYEIIQSEFQSGINGLPRINIDINNYIWYHRYNNAISFDGEKWNHFENQIDLKKYKTNLVFISNNGIPYLIFEEITNDNDTNERIVLYKYENNNFIKIFEINKLNENLNNSNIYNNYLKINAIFGKDYFDNFWFRVSSEVPPFFLDIGILKYTPEKNSIKKENEVNLYPNPTKDKIHINSKDIITELSLYSLNLSKILEFKSNNSTSQEIDVSNLPIGVYFIKVNDDFYKFVKE